jgi:hypothetical protein
VAVTFEPTATLAPDGVEVVLEALPMITRFAGKPVGPARDVVIHTTAPERDYAIAIGGDSVSLAPAGGAAPATPDLVLPAEAFIRLVYGRLDPDHTPSGVDEGDTLDALRATFPGV